MGVIAWIVPGAHADGIQGLFNLLAWFAALAGATILAGIRQQATDLRGVQPIECASWRSLDRPPAAAACCGREQATHEKRREARMTGMAAYIGRRSSPLSPAGEQVSLGSYTSYAEAQRVVDYLADHDFEVETTQIIGSDLRMVEQITGKLTWPRAALSGVAGGAWFGVFVGLLLRILTTVSFARAMEFGLSWGVLFGGVFAAVGFGLTGGRRDFTSRSATVPSRFEVLVSAAHSGHARAVLAGLSQ